MQLEKINTPLDVKRLSDDELKMLADEMRAAILNRVSKLGGHVGPNLGMVEAAIALHKVFDSPRDKIVFDVSHQSYPHKLLTGRKDAFLKDDKMFETSGYTNQDESEHDHFKVGHTSTSVSLACGLAKARDIKGEKHNVVAVIGDGSLSGGEALEGFNNAAVLNSNIIIVVNDNEMSIAENHGGLYTNLRALRDSNGEAPDNMFKALGFEYVYVGDGNNIPALTAAFEGVKDTHKPTVVHMHTQKGNGYKFAEENKEKWHWNVPFDIQTGNAKSTSSGESYASVTSDYLTQKVAADSSVVVVNAGTPGVFALTPDKRAALGQNYVDVGIAEEHAVAFSSALAKGGAKPVFLVMSSFIQRAYDQLSQDLALNNNPAVIVVFGGGISGADMTHLGTFDIPLISNIPNIVYLAPTNKQEYLAMLDWGLEQTSHPVVIRVPSVMADAPEKIQKNYDALGTYQIVQEGSKVAVLALGGFFELGQKTVDKLTAQGINATLINPRFISHLDTAMLERLKQNHELVITLEDGELDGGFGEKIARFYGDSAMKVLTYGAKKEFTDRVPVDILYERYRLTPELIIEDVSAALNK